MFERVIQEVCDASQVDFEESGVDQKTLLDLREVRDTFQMISGHISMRYWMVRSGVAAKAGGSEMVREAVLMGEHRLLRLPLYVPSVPALATVQRSHLSIAPGLYFLLPTALRPLSTHADYIYSYRLGRKSSP